MILMFKDFPLYGEETDTVYRNDLLPVYLRSRCNQDTFNDWLSRRVQAFSRKQIKNLSNIILFPQEDEYHTRIWLARITRAISVEDCYWLMLEDEQLTWNMVDPLHNKRINTLVPVLFDRSCDIDLSFDTVEYSTGGTVDKAWLRESGAFYMYKTTRWEIEVMVSKILDALGIKHVEYFESSLYGIQMCKCKCMCNESFSRVPARDVRDAYSNYEDFIRYVMREFTEDFCTMCIVDYLVANQDRHGMNWGFLMHNTSGKLVSLHPLFDHNWSFGNVAMCNEVRSKIFSDYTLKEVAVKFSEKFRLRCDKSKLPNFQNHLQREYFIHACEDCNVEFI